MVNKLLSSSEEAAASLAERIKTFKITNVPGEDIDQVNSLLKGAIRRLSQLQHRTSAATQEFNDEITRQMLAVFQTSSVPKFNDAFRHIQYQRRMEAAFKGTSTRNLLQRITYDMLFMMAEQTYRQLTESGAWTAASTTTGTKSIFTVEGKG